MDLVLQRDNTHWLFYDRPTGTTTFHILPILGLMMKRTFLLKILYYVFPVTLAGSILLFSAQYIGESLFLSQIIAMQRGDTPIIYLPAWQRQDEVYYKVESILARQPDILMLGTSRLYTFREQLFSLQPERFYNGAISHSKPQELASIVDILAQHDAMPDVLIVSLDIPYYNADATLVWENYTEYFIPPYNHFADFIRLGLTRTLDEMINHPLSYWSYVDLQDEAPRRQGIVALQDFRGSRNDGSFHIQNVEVDRTSRMTLQYSLYEGRVSIFEGGTGVHQGSLSALESLLQQAQDSGTTVIGIFPPFETELFNEMVNSNEFAYIQPARDSILELFSTYEMPVYDFTYPASVGGTDEELYDYWHPGERFSLRMFIEIAGDNMDVFDGYVNLPELEDRLENADNAFFVYEPNPYE